LLIPSTAIQGAAMPMRPRKKKRPNPKYEHAVFKLPGFYAVPDVTSCEGVERGRWTNMLVIRASTFDDRHLAIVLLLPAVAALVAAPPIAVPIGKATNYEPIEPAPFGKTLEIQPMDYFFCFRVINAEWWIPEFSNDKDQHLLVPFSVPAYKQLLRHLKTASF
jgi:hypothetical protein